MATWKVIKEKIKLFPHPNADSLELGKIGTFQVVIQKGLYNDGDIVLFAPEKSLLTGQLRDEFDKYLVGPEKNRVKGVTLRGEFSAGIIVPPHCIPFDLDTIEFDEDCSELLGISKWTPPIPQQLTGLVQPLETETKYSKHDAEHFGVYASQVDPEEQIVVTEKIHGSQIFTLYHNGKKTVSSKGMVDKGLEIIEDDKNSYWEACRNVGLWDILDKLYESGTVFKDTPIQVFGEIIPIQKGYSYGLNRMELRIFRVKIGGEEMGLHTLEHISPELFALWVPILYRGKLKDVNLYELKEGKEKMSGKELHIKEGIVVQPAVMRKDLDNKISLILKMLNSKYKETGEEFN